MAVAEISAAVTSLRAAYDISKAMISLRSAEAFREKAAELNGILLDALEKAVAARIAEADQIERVRALEAELAEFKKWDAEKRTYELKSIGRNAVAYMLKPDARGTEPPHWLCPTCYAKGQKAFLQPTGATIARARVYRCNGTGCQANITVEADPQW